MGGMAECAPDGVDLYEVRSMKHDMNIDGVADVGYEGTWIGTGHGEHPTDVVDTPDAEHYSCRPGSQGASK
jgi:hypothetical protein